MNEAIAAWGKPHLHQGIGIRRLTDSVYECRVDIDTRLAFLVEVREHELIFFFMGNHQEIQNLIRSSR